MAHGVFRTVLAIMLSLPLVAIACLSSPPPLKIGVNFFRPARSGPRLLLFYCSPRTLKTLTGR